MQITLEKLEELRACKDGKEWFAAQKESELRKVVDALMADNRDGWARWIVSRVMSKKQRVEWAVYCAEKVLHIFEEKYPSDDRPRKAIEAAKEYLKTGTADAAAYDAADAAYAAAYDAADAAYAAAAYAAAYAADAAAYAADAAYAAAAYDAADAAAAAKTKTRSEFLTELLSVG